MNLSDQYYSNELQENTGTKAGKELKINTLKSELPDIGKLPPQQNEAGTSREIILLNETGTPIVRQVNIISDANLYEQEWVSRCESSWSKK